MISLPSSKSGPHRGFLATKGRIFMDQTTLNMAAFFSILSSSFLGSFHCSLMCGPLVCAKLASKRAKSVQPGIILYNLGRLLSYTLLGSFLGFLSSRLNAYLPQLAQYLAIALGSFMVLWALGASFGISRFSLSAPSIKLPLWLPKNLSFLLFGFLTVFLPCASLTPAMALAASGGSAAYGAMVMAGMFFGTLPIMMLVPRFGKIFIKNKTKKAWRWASLGFIAAAGFLTAYRGLTLCLHH